MAVTLLTTTDGGRLYGVTSAKSAFAKKQSHPAIEQKPHAQSYIRNDPNALAGLSQNNPFILPQSDTIYDKPSNKASLAISTYKSFANMQRREEVQLLVGVDVYA